MNIDIDIDIDIDIVYIYICINIYTYIYIYTWLQLEEARHFGAGLKPTNKQNGIKQAAGADDYDYGIQQAGDDDNDF